jgi:hypothetical protein
MAGGCDIAVQADVDARVVANPPSQKARRLWHHCGELKSPRTNQKKDQPIEAGPLLSARDLHF